MNILDEIVAKRKADIERLGYTFGHDVPAERIRGEVVPFIAEKGTVLEVKRASPSKGDIAPELNAAETAESYAAAGTSAISVLTETNYFKGTLADLQEVCRAVDAYALANGTRRVAVLRKDFLLAPEEVDIAYRCGADAVLLIARILDVDTMRSMAEKCASLGMTAFIELRLEEDLRKLAAVAQTVDRRYIVCGVNARDLKNFTIDLLTPAGMLGDIRRIMGDDARVIFESGIRTPSAASFAGSLGFTGMLLGEAAARDPKNAAALVRAFVDSRMTKPAENWLRYAAKVRERSLSGRKRPFVKICGLTREADALKAAGLGADFLGFIFCAQSPRNVAPFVVSGIAASLYTAGLRDRVFTVGVITDVESAEARLAFDLLKTGALDFVQLHGCAGQFLSRKDVAVQDGLLETSEAAHYGAVNIMQEADLAGIDELCRCGEPRMLIDAKLGDKVGGTGTRVEPGLVEAVSRKTRLWLAGGITPENVQDIMTRFQPELIDVSSGVESKPGVKDAAKLESLFSRLLQLDA